MKAEKGVRRVRRDTRMILIALALAVVPVLAAAQSVAVLYAD